MFVIDVIPFSRAAPDGTLSYRSQVKLEPGALVSVMLRRTKIRALVVHCESARDLKSVIKRSSFSLSKSEPVREGSLPKALMQAAREVSEYHAVPIGSTLQALIGEYVAAELHLEETKQKNTKPHVFVYEAYEAPPAERSAYYRTLIADSQKKGGVVHLIAPTIAEILFWKETYADFKPLVLSGNAAAKDRIIIFEKANDFVGLVITTPTYAWLPMQNRSHYVVDRISAGTYCTQKRPYIDVRKAVEAYARTTNVSMVIGDYPLPLEYRPNPSKPLSVIPTNPISIIDVRTKKSSVPATATMVEAAHVQFKAVPEKLLESIQKEISAHKRVMVLAVRKGYAPIVVCHDCGQVVQDDRGLPLSFTIRNGVRSMRSIDGKTVRIADRLCVRCGSWNLVPLGIGIERVEEELRKAFPETPIVVLPAETLRTRAQVKKLLEKTSGGGSIVVGTEAAMPWLMLMQQEFPISLGVIASADSLLSLPFWRARERFVRLVLLFSSLSKKLLVTTRLPDDSVFSIMDSTKGAAFFAEENSLRKALRYPPYGTLVALQVEGSLAHRDAMQARIGSLLNDMPVVFLPDRPLTTTTARRTGVIVLAKDAWPNHVLSERLQSLGPSVRIVLDPESLW